jgi:hypothetical protein
MYRWLLGAGTLSCCRMRLDAVSALWVGFAQPRSRFIEERMWTWLHHRLHGGGRSCRIIVQPIPESGRWHWSAVRLGTCLELGVGAVRGVNWTEVFLCGNVQPSADSASSTTPLARSSPQASSQQQPRRSMKCCGSIQAYQKSHFLDELKLS